MTKKLLPCTYGYTHPFISKIDEFKEIFPSLNLGIDKGIYLFSDAPLDIRYVYTKEAVAVEIESAWESKSRLDSFDMFMHRWTNCIIKDDENKYPKTFEDALVKSQPVDLNHDYTTALNFLLYMLRVFHISHTNPIPPERYEKLFLTIRNEIDNVEDNSRYKSGIALMNVYKKNPHLLAKLGLPSRHYYIKNLWKNHLQKFCELSTLVYFLEHNPHYEGDTYFLPINDAYEICPRNIWLDHWAKKYGQRFCVDDGFYFNFSFQTNTGYYIDEAVFLEKVVVLWKENHPEIDENNLYYNCPTDINISPREFYHNENMQCQKDVVDFYNLDYKPGALLKIDDSFNHNDTEIYSPDCIEEIRKKGLLAKSLIGYMQINGNTRSSSFMVYKLKSGDQRQVLVEIDNFDNNELYSYLDPFSLDDDELAVILQEEGFHDVTYRGCCKVDETTIGFSMVSAKTDVTPSVWAGYISKVHELDDSDRELTLDEFRELLEWQKINEEKLKYLFKDNEFVRHFNQNYILI